MGQKFTSEDLFRIAEEHLSFVEREEFFFLASVRGFRQQIGGNITEPVSLTADEHDLFEKLFQGLKLSRGRGAR